MKISEDFLRIHDFCVKNGRFSQFLRYKLVKCST